MAVDSAISYGGSLYQAVVSVTAIFYSFLEFGEAGSADFGRSTVW